MNTPRRRGRPPVLTPEAVARAVLDVGFIELTFAAVRERLGVGESTLYRYAPDRDALVRMGMNQALLDATWPDYDGPWRGVLSEYAFTAWDLFAQYPGAAVEAGRGIIPEHTTHLFAELSACLTRAGFTPDAAVLACDLVMDLVADHRHGVEQRGETPVPMPAFDPEDPVAQAVSDAVTGDPLTWFKRKLDVVLDGIEHSLAPA